MPAPHHDGAAPEATPAATYEELTAELEAVVTRLEQGELSLDDALAAYARGVEIARHCNDLLDQAELRVSQLTVSLSRQSGTPTAGQRFLFDDEVEPDDE